MLIAAVLWISTSSTDAALGNYKFCREKNNESDCVLASYLGPSSYICMV